MAETAKQAATRETGRLSRRQDVDRHIGARVRKRRVMLGLTQQQMAELIGVSYEQAHKYETGINRLSAARLYAIAMALGVEVGYFFEGVRGGGAGPTSQERVAWYLARSFLELLDRSREEALCALAWALAGPEAFSDERFSDPDTLEGLAAPVTFAIKLMDVWALSEKEAARLLGFEGEKHFSELTSGAATLSTRDMKDRVRHLLRMREALHSLFRDTDAEREWLREARPELNGQSPLALLLKGSMENFLVVSQFVQWMVGR
jgi:transcriptional regulator with XRE-family HTH domain